MCFKIVNVFLFVCCIFCFDEEKEICGVYFKVDYNVKCEGLEYNCLVIVVYCVVFYIVIFLIVLFIVFWR